MSEEINPKGFLKDIQDYMRTKASKEDAEAILWWSLLRLQMLKMGYGVDDIPDVPVVCNVVSKGGRIKVDLFEMKGNNKDDNNKVGNINIKNLIK